jgi:ATP-binding cassette subfamily B protein
LTLTIPHGQSIALVGLNGAGKSTLVKLLCRFYDPTRGSISWDGVDIRDLPVTELRRRIGAVFQDYMTYDMTAAENIGVGDLEAAREPLIRAAAGRAGIHDTIAALPHGYDTTLSRVLLGPGSRRGGEANHSDESHGATLSGGQWQRLALARAFMRDKRDLLILDEPSSGLDPQAEHDVHERLRAHREGATSVLISHRLGATRGADLIVVLADGIVTEQGTHEQLMQLNGAYAQMFRVQAAGYREATEPTVVGLSAAGPSGSRVAAAAAFGISQ